MLESLPNCDCQYTAILPRQQIYCKDTENDVGDEDATTNLHAIDLCRIDGCNNRAEGPPPSKCAECNKARIKETKWTEARPQRNLAKQIYERDRAKRETEVCDNEANQLKQWELNRNAVLEKYPQITPKDLRSASDLHHEFRNQSHSKEGVLKKEVKRALDRKKQEAKKKAQAMEEVRKAQEA